jgi:hypothetical protein
MVICVKYDIAKRCLLNAFLPSTAKKHLIQCKNAQSAFFTECWDDIFTTVTWKVQKIAKGGLLEVV